MACAPPILNTSEMPLRFAATRVAALTLPSRPAGVHKTRTGHAAMAAGTASMIAAEGNGADPAGTYRPTEASAWWRFLRTEQPSESVADALGRLHRVLHPQPTEAAGEFTGLAKQAEVYAETISDVSKSAYLTGIAATCRRRGETAAPTSIEETTQEVREAQRVALRRSGSSARPNFRWYPRRSRSARPRTHRREPAVRRNRRP